MTPTQRLIAAAKAVHDEHWDYYEKSDHGEWSSLQRSTMDIAGPKYVELHEALAACEEAGSGQEACVVVTDEMINALYENFTPHQFLEGDPDSVRRGIAAVLKLAARGPT